MYLELFKGIFNNQEKCLVWENKLMRLVKKEIIYNGNLKILNLNLNY